MTAERQRSNSRGDIRSDCVVTAGATAAERQRSDSGAIAVRKRSDFRISDIVFIRFFPRSLHEILSVLQSREKYFGTNCTLTLRMYRYIQESKKLRVLIINKDERKSLARKNGNENHTWIWNDSGAQ